VGKFNKRSGENLNAYRSGDCFGCLADRALNKCGHGPWRLLSQTCTRGDSSQGLGIYGYVGPSRLKVVIMKVVILKDDILQGVWPIKDLGAMALVRKRPVVVRRNYHTVKLGFRRLNSMVHYTWCIWLWICRLWAQAGARRSLLVLGAEGLVMSGSVCRSF
jgi:hypothetical protein